MFFSSLTFLSFLCWPLQQRQVLLFAVLQPCLDVAHNVVRGVGWRFWWHWMGRILGWLRELCAERSWAQWAVSAWLLWEPEFQTCASESSPAPGMEREMGSWGWGEQQTIFVVKTTAFVSGLYSSHHTGSSTSLWCIPGAGEVQRMSCKKCK